MTDVREAALNLFLNRVSARSRLTDDERQAIRDLPGTVAIVQSNRDLVRLGEVVDRTCLVAEGLMARFGQTREGARQISALYVPGDMPDLHSFVVPRASWALTALTKTTVLRVPHAAIERVTERCPAIAKAFWRDCTLDAAITSEWILNIGRRSARARLAHLLCEMAARYEQIGRFGGLSFALPLSQVHLADALGLTSVHVNRMLGSLKRAGIVQMTKQVVHVLDWSALVSAADFDANYLQLDNALDPSGKTSVIKHD